MALTCTSDNTVSGGVFGLSVMQPNEKKNQKPVSIMPNSNGYWQVPMVRAFQRWTGA